MNTELEKLEKQCKSYLRMKQRIIVRMERLLEDDLNKGKISKEEYYNLNAKLMEMKFQVNILKLIRPEALN